MQKIGDPYPDEIRAFMSIDEVHELARFENVSIALHGCMHLRLENIVRRTERMSAFARDLKDGYAAFRSYGFMSDIFVYPYAFSEDGYDYAVRKFGFGRIYARPGAYRIPVEDIVNECSRS